MTQTAASKSLLITLLIVTLASAFLVVLALKRWHDKNHWTRVSAAQVESQIKQHVPIGTSREQVAAYLDAEKIAHYFYGDLYKGTAYYNCEVALVPNAASSGLVITDIQIIFKFDNTMRLVSYSVRASTKGP